MGYRTYVCNKYDVEYGGHIGTSNNQDKIIEAIEHLRTLGYHSRNIECYMDYNDSLEYLEINIESFLRLYDMLKKIRDFPKEHLSIINDIKNAIDNLPDKDYLGGFVRFESF